MKRFTAVLSAAALVAGFAQVSFAQEHHDQVKDVDRLDAARTIIEQTEAVPEKAIPQTLLSKAQCVVVIPNVIKGAFVFGAERGKGVATCRTPHGWSAPAFVQLTGVSFGFQIGGQATDLVLIAMNRDGLQHALASKVKLGADASAAAGPVGRDSNVDTNITLNTEFITYSRAKGLFAGVDLSGAVLAPDNDDARAEYGSEIPYQQLLNGGTPVPENARPFVHTVARYFVQARNTH